jgi:hypothetical protein
MYTGAFHSFSIFTPFHVNLPGASTEMPEWTIGIEALAHKETSRWGNSYVSCECVDTTIKRGRDRTTSPLGRIHSRDRHRLAAFSCRWLQPRR